LNTLQLYAYNSLDRHKAASMRYITIQKICVHMCQCNVDK